MRVELTGDIFQGRCQVGSEFCRARVSGSVAVVESSCGQRITVCGACLFPCLLPAVSCPAALPCDPSHGNVGDS